MTMLKRRKRSSRDSNLLDMVPVLRDGLTTERESGRVTVHVPRQSWIERQAVRFLKQPAVIKVSLDELGSAVVSRCDGAHTVSDIADGLRDGFGEAAEPLLPRLVKFIEVMEANGWLDWLEVPAGLETDVQPAVKTASR